MRHGECAYSFETGKWYVMTVEFYEDQVIAHLDHEHLAYGKHPMINQERTYLACKWIRQVLVLITYRFLAPPGIHRRKIIYSSSINKVENFLLLKQFRKNTKSSRVTFMQAFIWRTQNTRRWSKMWRNLTHKKKSFSQKPLVATRIFKSKFNH